MPEARKAAGCKRDLKEDLVYVLVFIIGITCNVCYNHLCVFRRTTSHAGLLNGKQE